MYVHVDNATDVDAVRLAEVFASFTFVQYVIEPTHRLGDPLDLVAAFPDCEVINICVVSAGVFSDHGLVACSVPAYRDVVPVSSRMVRSWRSVNQDDLSAAIRSSALGDVPSGVVSQLFKTHKITLRRLADKFTLLYAVRSRQRPLASWFNADCRVVRRNFHRLERKYRKTNRLRTERRGRWQSETNSSSSGLKKMNTGPSALPASVTSQRSCGDRWRRFYAGESGSHTALSADAFFEFSED